MGNEQAISSAAADLRRRPMWMSLSLVIVLAIALTWFIGRPLIGSISQTKTAEKTYRSDLDGFSLSYPSGWKLLTREELTKFQGVFVFAVERRQPKGLFGVRVQPVKAKKVALKSVASALDKAMPKNFRRFKRAARAVVPLDNGQRALKYEYTFTSGQRLKIREQLIIVPAGRRVYYLTAWAEDRNFKRLRADFSRMAQSFNIN